MCLDGSFPLNELFMLPLFKLTHLAGTDWDTCCVSFCRCVLWQGTGELLSVLVQKAECNKRCVRVVSQLPHSNQVRWLLCVLQRRFQFSNPELNLFSNPAAGKGVPTAVGLLEKRFGERCSFLEEKCVVTHLSWEVTWYTSLSVAPGLKLFSGLRRLEWRL